MVTCCVGSFLIYISSFNKFKNFILNTSAVGNSILVEYKVCREDVDYDRTRKS